MDKRSLKEKLSGLDALYLRHLRYLLTGVVALMLCLSMTLFFSFERITRSTVFNDALTLLSQTAENTADLVDTCKQITNQIQSDKTITPILCYSSATPGEEATALEQLALYKHTVQSISSIYIYNARSGQIYISDIEGDNDNRIKKISDFSDQDAVELIENYTDYPSYTPIPRSLSGENGYTYIGYGFRDKNSSGGLNSAVLVNISADWLQSILSPDNLQTEGETLIISTDGKLVSDSTAFPMGSDLSERYPDVYAGISQDSSGSFVAKLGNTRYFIAYTAPDSLGWQYLRLIPYQSIMRNIKRMRALTVAILFGFLVVGLLVVWYLNRVLYQPIDRYKEDISRLETSERERFPVLKQAFLRRLLLTPTVKDAEFFRQLEEYACSFDLQKPFYLAMIRLDHSGQMEQTMSAVDAERCRYAVLNIGCEIAGEYFLTEGVDLQRNRMVMILNVREQIPSSVQLRSMAENIRDLIAQHLSVSVSISFSEEGGLEQLPQLYETIQENSFQHLFTGDGSIVVGKRENHMQDYRYPEKKEKLLAEALSRGNTEKALGIYREIIGECWGAPIYIVNTTVLRLVSTCNQVAGTLPSMQENSSYFIDLSQYETTGQLEEAFRGIFTAISEAVHSRSGGRADQQIEAIDGLIGERYADPSLSIESIADALGLSASYTGRIYKQATGQTILEKLLEVRMNAARRILESTDAPVASVSQMTGFSSDSYFYKIFKQENGMTPAAYRKQLTK